MGITKVKLLIKNPYDLTRSMEGEFLVDSGAHFTVVPAKMVKKLKLKAAYKQDFSLAEVGSTPRNANFASVSPSII